MKIKGVVFKMQSQEIKRGRKEDAPQRWFRDRVILLVQMQPSLAPEALEMDEIFTEHYELLRLLEVQTLIPSGILVVSDDKEFLQWTEKQRFHTATLYNIDSIIGYIHNIEYQKEV